MHHFTLLLLYCITNCLQDAASSMFADMLKSAYSMNSEVHIRQDLAAVDVRCWPCLGDSRQHIHVCSEDLQFVDLVDNASSVHIGRIDV